MLKEKISFQDGMPINVYVANIKEYPIHFHEGLEIAYVIDGSIHLKNGYYTYELNQGDIFILNEREIHSYYSSGIENAVMILQIELRYFEKFFHSIGNSFFITDVKDKDDESLELLKTLMIKIMLGVANRGKNYVNNAIKYSSNILQCLMDEFQYFLMEEGRFVNETKNRGNRILAERLYRIMDYMYENYDRKLSLSEIAELEHLSVCYLSHIMKEKVGLNFQDFLNFIRVEESEKLLLGGTKRVSAIANECGFSAVRYYVKCFEKWFGMHPDDYRKKYAGKVHSREMQAEHRILQPEEVIDIIKKQANDIYCEINKENVVKVDVIDVNLDLDSLDQVKEEVHFHFTPICDLETVSRYLEETLNVCKDLKMKEIGLAVKHDDINLLTIDKFLSIGVEPTICVREGEALGVGFERLKKTLEKRSRLKVVWLKEQDRGEGNFAYDSIAMIPYIINKVMSQELQTNQINCIVDDTNEMKEIKGKNGIITSNLIRKPSYYAYKMLTDLRGKLISSGENHIITVADDQSIRILLYVEPKDSYVKGRIGALPKDHITILETVEHARQIGTEKDIVVRINGLQGKYKLYRYKNTKECNVLTFYSRLEYPDVITIEEENLCKLGSGPDVEFSTTMADQALRIQAHLGNFESEMIIVYPF